MEYFYLILLIGAVANPPVVTAMRRNDDQNQSRRSDSLSPGLSHNPRGVPSLIVLHQDRHGGTYMSDPTNRNPSPHRLPNFVFDLIPFDLAHPSLYTRALVRSWLIKECTSENRNHRLGRIAGKTTLFNALTGGAASTGGYGAARVNVGAAHVADPRVDALSKVFKPKKTTYAAVNFVDAGVGDGGAARMRRPSPRRWRGRMRFWWWCAAFQDAGVPHPRESIDPARDLADVRLDLLLRDLSVVERRRERLEKLVRVKKDPAEAAEFALLTKIQETLEDGRPVRALKLGEEEMRIIKGFGFLSAKPLLVVVNVGEDQLGEDLGGFGEADVESKPVVLAARLEEELAQLPGEEQAEFLADYALESSALDKVIRASFSLLDLRCFFTVSEGEVRAWPVRAGTIALHAAGTIHSDMERGFIRAEVVTYADFMAAGSLAAARDRGTLRLEGKDYVVKDGDIFHVRFNV